MIIDWALRYVQSYKASVLFFGPIWVLPFKISSMKEPPVRYVFQSNSQMRFMVPWVTIGGWSCLSWVIFLWPIDWKAHQEFRDVLCDIFSVKLPGNSARWPSSTVKGDVLSNERRKQLSSTSSTTHFRGHGQVVVPFHGKKVYFRP